MIKEAMAHEIRYHSFITPFLIREIRELAEGVMAVLDDKMIFRVYFDKTKIKLAGNCPWIDASLKIDGFDGDLGFIEAPIIKDWQSVIEKSRLSFVSGSKRHYMGFRKGRAATINLQRKQNKMPIVWHEEPITITLP